MAEFCFYKMLVVWQYGYAYAAEVLFLKNLIIWVKCETKIILKQNTYVFLTSTVRFNFFHGRRERLFLFKFVFCIFVINCDVWWKNFLYPFWLFLSKERKFWESKKVTQYKMWIPTRRKCQYYIIVQFVNSLQGHQQSPYKIWKCAQYPRQQKQSHQKRFLTFGKFLEIENIFEQKKKRILIENWRKFKHEQHKRFW